MKILPGILFLVVSIHLHGQETVMAILQKRSLPAVNLSTDGWVRYNKYAPHYIEGRAVMREYFKNEDSITDRRLFCVDIVAKDTLIVSWKLSTFRDEEVIAIDSFKDARYKPPAVPRAKPEPNIEQIAFDYFMAGIDTIKFFNSDTSFKFDIHKSKLYFSKEVKSHASFFSEFNINKKTLAFLGVKSDVDLKKNLYYTEIGRKYIIANQSFISTNVNSFNELEDTRKEPTDIKIKMWNRLFFSGNYYVYITANVRIDMVKNSFLVKIDKNGKPAGIIRSMQML